MYLFYVPLCLSLLSSYSLYPDRANALRKAGLAPPNLPTLGELWRM